LGSHGFGVGVVIKRVSEWWMGGDGETNIAKERRCASLES